MIKVISFIQFAFFFCSISFQPLLGQDNDQDAFFIRHIYDHSLTRAKAYEWLTTLSEEIGGRLSGTPQAEAGVLYTKRLLDEMGLDSVWLQPCEVPHWQRGEKEIVRIVGSSIVGSKELNACALGNSEGSGPDGLSGEVVEVTTLDEAREMGFAGLDGKIVFFSRPMDPTQIRTFNAYGGAVDQRVAGPALVANYGAIACIVRSMGSSEDDLPHTGTTTFGENDPKIPALAISTNDATLLSNLLKQEKINLYIRNTSTMLEPVISHNVIAEIKGSDFPEEIILVGGHLDSWDLGGGAHDDGAGCVHAMQVMKTLVDLDYRPKRSIRCVLFMNEENGLGGGREYARVSNEKGEYHLAAIESDAGGFTPRGFACTAEESVLTNMLQSLNSRMPLLEAYGLTLSPGGGGADISPLKSQEGLLIGFRPDSQRYFDFHHTAADRIEAVNKRELELGAAAITSLVYLIDQYGL